MNDHFPEKVPQENLITSLAKSFLKALTGIFNLNSQDQETNVPPQEEMAIQDAPKLFSAPCETLPADSTDRKEQIMVTSSAHMASSKAASVQTSSRPDFWETVTQYYKREPVQEKELVVGFDFGTSCSKIVIQDVALRQSYAVPFGELAFANNRYLLPTTVYINDSGEMNLVSGDHRFSDLKVGLIGHGGSAPPTGDSVRFSPGAKGIAVGYIALALREARKWFWEKKFEVYRDIRIIWQINIGMPARSYDDRELHRVFRTVALAAWNLSVIEGAVTVKSAKTAVKEAEGALDEVGWTDDERNGRIHPDYAQAVPEVIAVVIGFARSPLRQNGMYLLADIGASTLDISTFMLYKNPAGEDLYSILTAEIQPLGSLRLHRKRIEHVRMCTERRCKELTTFNDANSPIPKIREYLPNLEECSSVDGVFRDQCSRVFSAVVAETKINRNPNSVAWDTGLPVFLCGGGAYMPVYVDAAVEAQKRLTTMNVSGFNFVDLPKPDNLEATGLLPEHYHRLGVAYGLSFSRLDMGEILAPREIEDR